MKKNKIIIFAILIVAITGCKKYEVNPTTHLNPSYQKYYITEFKTYHNDSLVMNVDSNLVNSILVTIDDNKINEYVDCNIRDKNYRMVKKINMYYSYEIEYKHFELHMSNSPTLTYFDTNNKLKIVYTFK